jgi:hypothetical protein
MAGEESLSMEVREVGVETSNGRQKPQAHRISQQPPGAHDSSDITPPPRLFRILQREHISIGHARNVSLGAFDCESERFEVDRMARGGLMPSSTVNGEDVGAGGDGCSYKLIC